jgi:hypothetical protein
MSRLQQGLHVELLLGESDVLARVDPGLHAGEELELVAEAPVADLLALEVGRGGDVLVLERDLQRPRALEDLADVGDAGALLARLQRLGHPGDRVVGAPLRQLGLGHDVGAALEDLDVEPGVLVEALLQRGEVAGELGLGEPLQLQLDLGQLLGAAGGGGRGARGRVVAAPAGRHRQHARGQRGRPGGSR